MEFHQLKVSNIHRETQEAVTVKFHIPEHLKETYEFIPGQYLTLSATIDGNEVRRAYSISSGLDDQELRVAVKKINGGIFSSFVNDELKEGDSLGVLPPMGRFVAEMNPENKKSYVLVAVGSGITPMMSIMKSVLSREPNSEVTLIYGNRKFETIIFREEIENLKDTHLGRLRVFHTLSKEMNEIDLFCGRIDGEKMKTFFNTFLNIKECDGMYLCGPEQMIHSVKDQMIEMGMDKKDIHFELFITDKQLKASAKPVVEEKVESEKNISLEVTLYGQKWDMKMSDDEFILDAASSQGLDLPFSCKGGMCCTCKAKVLEGKVDMDVNYALYEDEVADGYVLTCQARPKSNFVSLDFDQ